MANITYEELSLLMKIVNDNDTVLEQIISSFLKGTAKSDHFRICCGVTVLIHDSVLLNRQRLVAAVILCGAFKSDVDYLNPFLSVLLNMVESYSTNTIEKSILSKLLRSNKYYNEIIKKTINQVYNEFSAKEADELDMSEIQMLRDKYDEVGPAVMSFRRLGVPAVLSISNYHFTAGAEDILSGKTIESNREDMYSKTWTDEELLEEARVLEQLYGSDHFSEVTLAPSFVQFCPPMLEITDEELCWMDLKDRHCHSLLWSHDRLPGGTEMTSKVSNAGQKSAEGGKGGTSAAAHQKEEPNTLMSSIFTTPLNPKQQQQVIKQIKSNANVVRTCGLTPEKLPHLVENNWAIAVQCIVKVINTCSSSVSGEYLHVLEGLEMTFHSIETFSGLSADADLPVDFTQRYLAKCMRACENIKDKFSQVRRLSLYLKIQPSGDHLFFEQSRFVRLVCAVIQSLLRKNASSIQGLFPEIQAFCLNFSKVKEALTLYSAVKAAADN